MQYRESVSLILSTALRVLIREEKVMEDMPKPVVQNVFRSLGNRQDRLNNIIKNKFIPIL